MVSFSVRGINCLYFRDAKPHAKAEVVHVGRTLPATAFSRFKPISMPPVRTVHFVEYSYLDNDNDQDIVEHVQKRSYVSEFRRPLNAFHLWFRGMDSSGVFSLASFATCCLVIEFEMVMMPVHCYVKT